MREVKFYFLCISVALVLALLMTLGGAYLAGRYRLATPTGKAAATRSDGR